MRRILIVRNDKVGDLVLALPVLAAIRKALPKAFVGWLASPYAAPLLEQDSRLGACVADKRPDTLSKLKALRFDTALHLYATAGNAWLTRRAGIKGNIGTNGRIFSFLYSRRLPIRRSHGEKSEADYNLDHLAPLGIRPGLAQAQLELGPKAKSGAAAWLKMNGLKAGGFAVLHPGTGGSSQRWSPESFVKLGLALRRRFRLKLLVSGGPDEKALVESVAKGCRAEALLAGGLSLPAFAALLGRAKIFCSAATGPMHLAAAQGTPTLSFFPPCRSMSPRRWHALGPRRAVLSPKGLGLDIPKSGMNFVERISVDEALQAASTLLKDMNA